MLLRPYYVIYLCVFILICSFTNADGQDQPLLINEILASNSQVDEFGSSLDWIELYNPGPDAVQLENFSLSDDPLSPRKWMLPAVRLEAKAYFFVYATGYGIFSPGEYHTNFRLRRAGEFLGLFDSDLVLIDGIYYPEQEQDISYGRELGNFGQWLFFDPPSPMAENRNGFFGDAPTPVLSMPAGIYSGNVTITITSDHPDAVIRYTLDGSAPDQTSPRYSGAIRLTKTTPVRARAFVADYAPSRIATHTYLINEEITLPIISISTDPDNLFDRTIGIYANATSHGERWERPVSMEWIKPNGEVGFQIDSGLRIHGGASRSRSDKKSFRLYFRSEYGPGRLKYPVIPSTTVESFDRLILRAGYNDSWGHWDSEQRRVAVYISDELGRVVHNDMGFLASHGTFANLYLNGEYWGLYNPCERYDDEFFKSYYGYEDWEVVSDDAVRDGNGDDWNALRNFVSSRDMSVTANYEAFKTMVDIEQITSYYILNIWVQNHDWPHHNWAAAREETPGAKWRFYVWDIEDSFGSGASRGSYTQNTYNSARNGGSTIGTVFNRLVRNKEYQAYFIQELEKYLASTLSKEHLLMRLESLADITRSTMNMEAARWNQTKNLGEWEKALDIARTFIDRRTDYVRKYVYEAFSVPTPRPTNTPGGVPPTPTPTRTPTIPGSIATPTPTPLYPVPTPTPQGPLGDLGLFTHHQDIGDVNAAGSASFNAQSGEYRVEGSGADIWGSVDEFHFLFKQISGDFTLEAKMDALNLGSNDWAKMLLMARQSLDPSAANFASRLRESNREASSQWRSGQGESSGSTAGGSRIAQNRHDSRLRLVREGHTFTTYYFDVQMNGWSLLDSQTVVLSDPIYVGLAVTSHEDGSITRGIFTEVSLTTPFVSVWDWRMF
jgi:hypothetical protein